MFGWGWPREGCDFWPISLQWSKRNAGLNYYTLEMLEKIVKNEGTHNVPDEQLKEGVYYRGVFVDDLSKLQDNPELEIQNLQNRYNEERYADIYDFQILMMSDRKFTNDNVSLNLFYPSFDLKDSGQDNSSNMSENSVYQHTLTLRMRHITEATFKYYRSIAIQQTLGNSLYSEPATIVNNIKNGLGCFSVFNTVNVNLLEWKTYEYRKKEE
jgi:hypothetical protein